ncbi:MAG: hypothetical protein HW419_4148 [Deltaproteobacteria bacterium]|nr:hypothetical protein [Deltaproteobacteria bacterium]
MSEPKADPVLNAAIMKVVNNQLRGNNPPQTGQTFKRLMAAGHSEQEAKRLIACVVSAEVFDVLKQQQPFNLERFVKALDKLPTLPWEEEE